MRTIFFATLIAAALAIPTYKLSASSPGIAASFEDWKTTHGKIYEGEEHAKRLEIYTANSILIEKHNSEGHSWTMAHNQFSDLTPKEFNDLQTLWSSNLGTDESIAHSRHVASNESLPSSVDWRTQGLVNDIKNQGQCGSCWAFSTVVSYEGQVAKKTGQLQSFSEQNLVDCVKDESSCCNGCQGGLMDYAFQYMMDKQSGLDDTESSYPYTGKDGTCSFTKNKAGTAAVTKFTDITKGSESDLKDAVANVGPISIAVDANMFWQFYHGGVFSPLFCNKSSLNHGVAIVGYGADYWIVRNSWGTTWGESGYMRIKSGSNICGLANSAVYPTV